ncbi:autotransporter domain-containing protein [Mesorhizobium sp. DCY119]|uniref:autotransporter domain-containing protein n=1 Tax=Mesorhizobium sp. DCY119 TaxID=2108445 RepID=UPI000E71A394|nr:autotransporter domain-containing protein [Mesorhizobium sp. DCY119]RJG41438.1 autotransporter domain-containing protein [Mesorhizobium sp. DCY119]
MSFNIGQGRTIAGGNGGARSANDTANFANAGAGGVGLSGSGLTVSLSGNISGGLGGDGTTRANAVNFTGGNNFLTLNNGWSLSGGIGVTGELTFDQTDDATVSNTISGSGTLTKTGAGTLTLTGNNDYSGGTTVAAGTLQLGQTNAAGSGGLTVNGGTFAMGIYNQTVSSLQGTGGTVNLGNGTLTVNQSVNTSFDGNVNSGSIGVLTKQGTGTLTMNGTISGGHVGIEGGTLVLNGANTYGGATFLRNATLIVGDDKALSGSTLTALGPNATLSANKAVTLANDIILQRAVNGHLTVDTNADLTLSGVISDTAGAGGTLTKTGSGALILTGANTYAGTTTITAGVLQVGDGGTTGELGSGDIVNNSQLIFDRSDTFTVANTISGSGTLTKTGEGMMELSGTNGYSGGTTISQGKIAISDDANLGAATGQLILNGGTLGTLADIETDRAISLGALGGSFAPDLGTQLTLGADIDGIGGLEVDGRGTLVLTGTNSYQGGTTVSEGTLVLGTTASGSLSGSGGLTTTILGPIVNSNYFISVVEVVNADLSGVTTIKNNNEISFYNSTSASTAGITNDGMLVFYDTSSAGNARIANSYVVIFDDASRAGKARISNSGVVVFDGTSSADNAIITSTNSGAVLFEGRSSAGSATITTPNGGLVLFDQASSAGNAKITNNGTVVFAGTSNASNATITATDASYGVYFGDHATASNAALVANGGFFDFSSTYGADGDGVVTAGSIAGTTTGTFFLGENRLIVGGSGASTEFAGEIADEDPMCGCGLTGGSLVKVGAGTLTLSGTSSYTGGTTVSEGRLIVNGSIASSSQITVGSGGYLGGSGTLGTMLLQSGGIIAPGNSIGTLKVNGDLTLAAGSTYQVEIAGTGTSDRIDVTGKATVAGSNVSVMALDPKVSYQNGQTYRILNADGGVSGTFTAPTTRSAFLDLTLVHEAKAVDLTVKVKGANPDPEEPEEPGTPPLFGTVAETRNQFATAGALDSLQQSGASLALYNALLVLDAAQARAAFDGLSSEVHASAKTALIEDAAHIRNAANDRIRAVFESVGAEPIPVLAYGPDGQHLAPASSDHGLAVWGNAFGSWGHVNSDGNASRLDHSTGGLLVGGDALVGDWRLGLLAGYSRSSFDVKDRASSGDSDNYHVGLYGGTQWGALALRTGLAYSWHDIETRRDVAFPGFSDQLKGDYHAGTTQLFGELGYGIEAGAFSFEPFANLAYVNLNSRGFAEQGAAAALTAASQTTDVTFTTLGLRAASAFTLGSVEVTAKGMLGWRHAFGDVTPLSTAAFAGSNAFTVAGTPIARNAALVEAGLDLKLSDNASMTASYTGQYGSGAQENGFKARLGVAF